MKHNSTAKVLALALLFFILVLSIFFFSSQTSKDSMRVSNQALAVYYSLDEQFGLSKVPATQALKHFFTEVVLQGQYKTPEALIRKLAHFSLYGLLGLLTTSLIWQLAKGTKLRVGIAWLCGTSLPALVAVFDESWQILSQRTASLQDVLLDTLGGISGALLCTLVLLTLKVFSKGR